MFVTIAKFGNRLFTKYLLAANIGMSCLLTNSGDFIVQGMEFYQDKKSPKKMHSDEWLDWDRTGNVFKVGAVLGVFNHYWYRLLDSKLQGTTAKMILKKVVIDQVVASPACSAIYMIGISLLEQVTFREAVKEFKDKFVFVYMADWSYWPAAQGINFKYIPDRYRGIYVSAANFVWTVFLSYVQFVDEKHLGAAHENDSEEKPENQPKKMK